MFRGRCHIWKGKVMIDYLQTQYNVTNKSGINYTMLLTNEN